MDISKIFAGNDSIGYHEFIVLEKVYICFKSDFIHITDEGHIKFGKYYPKHTGIYIFTERRMIVFCKDMSPFNEHYLVKPTDFNCFRDSINEYLGVSSMQMKGIYKHCMTITEPKIYQGIPPILSPFLIDDTVMKDYSDFVDAGGQSQYPLDIPLVYSSLVKGRRRLVVNDCTKTVFAYGCGPTVNVYDDGNEYILYEL